jgi:hypothetical protein
MLRLLRANYSLRWRKSRGAVVAVNDTVTDAEPKRMHEQGARGIRFNLARAGAKTPEMIEPCRIGSTS